MKKLCKNCQSFEEYYIATNYSAFIDGVEYIYRVGTAPQNLPCGSAFTHISSISVVTAFNPCSQALSFVENLRRNNSLRMWLKYKKYHYFEGKGEATDGSWQPEDSFFVVNISPEKLRYVLYRFGQCAALRVERNTLPFLFWQM